MNFQKNIEMIARIDGDEFAILTKPLDDEVSIEKIAKEMLRIFEQTFEIKDYNLFASACIGIGIYPESGSNTGSLMKNTDLALYLAEKRGKNNYQIFSPQSEYCNV